MRVFVTGVPCIRDLYAWVWVLSIQYCIGMGACVTIIAGSQGYWVLMILLQFLVRFFVGLRYRYHDQCFVLSLSRSFVRSSYIVPFSSCPRFASLARIHYPGEQIGMDRNGLGRTHTGWCILPVFPDHHRITDTPALMQDGVSRVEGGNLKEVGFL